MSSVGNILKVKKIYDVNELWFADDTHQYTAYTGATTAYPEIIDGTTHAVGTQAFGILESGGAQTLFVDQQAKFLLGNPALVESDNVRLDPLFNEVSVGATGNEQTQMRANTNDVQLSVGENTPNQPPITNPTNSIYRGSITTGIIRHPNQQPLDTTQGWPTSSVNMWSGDGMFNCGGGGCPFSVGNNFSFLVVPGDKLIAKLGDINGATDACWGDNQQIRGRVIGTEFNGINIPVEYIVDGVLQVNITAEWYWTIVGTPAVPNVARLKVEHQRAGVVLKTWALDAIESHSINHYSCGGSRCFFANGATWPVPMTFQTGDNFISYVENDPASPASMQNADVQATYQLFHSN